MATLISVNDAAYPAAQLARFTTATNYSTDALSEITRGRRVEFTGTAGLIQVVGTANNPSFGVVRKVHSTTELDVLLDHCAQPARAGEAIAPGNLLSVGADGDMEVEDSTDNATHMALTGGADTQEIFVMPYYTSKDTA